MTPVRTIVAEDELIERSPDKRVLPRIKLRVAKLEPDAGGKTVSGAGGRYPSDECGLIAL